VDSYDYDALQLLLASLITTIVVFLFTTWGCYFLCFAGVYIIRLTIERILSKLISAIEDNVTVVARLVNGGRNGDDAWKTVFKFDYRGTKHNYVEFVIELGRK